MIKRLWNRIKNAELPGWSVLAGLLGTAVLAYGLLIPWLGFYWDDWAFIWISQKLGSAGLVRYFATNRPVWGLFFQASTALLGEEPLRWQIFGLFWRLAAAAAFWALLRLMLPRRVGLAAAAALFFLVYPSFDQAPIAVTYGHFFLIYTAFLFSLAAMLAAARGLGRKGVWLVLGLVFSLVNLLSMEYFFLLDLIRLPLLLVVETQQQGSLKKAWRPALRSWLPYLAVFLTAVVWRLFIFPHQTHNYQFGLLDQLRTAPLAAVLRLASTAASDLIAVLGGAWVKAFRLPDPVQLGMRTFAFTLAVMAAGAGLTGGLLFWLRRSGTETGRCAPAAALSVGLLAAVAAGGPFWLTGLPIGLEYPNNRFTLPFLLGAALFAAGLIELLPRRGLRALAAALLVGAALGVQFQSANAYRRDFSVQKQLFWQLAWRAPAIAPGTAVLINDLPTRYTSDNSLTAPLNWIYGGQPEDPLRMPYVLYTPSIRRETGLKGLRPGTPIEQDYLAATFYGSTDQLLALVYQPPACLRVLDPLVDPLNPLLPLEMREAAAVSRPAQVRGGAKAVPPAAIYGTEPAHGWCYYFQQADLARQQGDWEHAAALGDEAFALDDHPNDPAERFPFIEACAHTAAWPRAVELSREALQITPLMQAPVCRLWQRIIAETPASAEKSLAVQQVENELGCGPTQP